jgi:hypothetical protein
VGAGLAGAGALDLGRGQASLLGQGVQDLEAVAQLLYERGWAGGGGLLGFLQQLGPQPERELGLGGLLGGAGLAGGGGQLGDAVADQLHGASSLWRRSAAINLASTSASRRAARSR